MESEGSSEWSLSAVADVVRAAVPDRDMIVCGDVRRTHREVAERSKGLAGFLVERGVGVRVERDRLDPWESGQDAVALVLHNCAEYLEAMYGAFRARAAPFNVNQHYHPDEIGALLADVGARAVVYHRRLGPHLAAGVDTTDLLLIDVDDGSGTAPLEDSTNFEDAVSTSGAAALPTSSPDDLYLICTGGTTGRPKAVLWRQADIYVAAMAGADSATAESIAVGARDGGVAWYPVPPLMHAAAQWTAFCGFHTGGTVVLHDDSGSFDARRVLEAAERERVFLMSIVGDAHAQPLIEELRSSRHDLSGLSVLGTGGAVTSEHYKEQLLELLPDLLIRDGYGASETGGMAFGAQTRGQRSDGFEPGAGAAVASADRSRLLEPGEEEVGWVARCGRVPLGYLGDREKSEETFPTIEGRRVSIPGDRGMLLADGHIRLLGRDSMVVNSGAEKVYVEEVEEVLRTHPDVFDALVVGRPSPRFGQEVVAVVAPREGAIVDPSAIRAFVAERIARFKAPRAVLVCETVERHANGKADYRWARDVALDAVDATG